VKICSECIHLIPGSWYCPKLGRKMDPAGRSCFFFEKLKIDNPEPDAPGQTFLGICQGASLYE